MGTVVMTGPSQSNFADAYQELKRRGGAVEVANAHDITDNAERLLSDKAACVEMQQRAAAGVAAMIGALDVTAGALDALLSTSGDHFEPDERLQRAS